MSESLVIEVVRKTVQTFASPKAASLMVNGNFEVGGIAPLGAAYAFVNDRAISNLEASSGKRVAAFDHDKAQAQLISRVGARPVAADVMNFGWLRAPEYAGVRLERYPSVQGWVERIATRSAVLRGLQAIA